jgi:hypothetical protein
MLHRLSSAGIQRAPQAKCSRPLNFKNKIGFFLTGGVYNQ